jgi:hypothetical protein
VTTKTLTGSNSNYVMSGSGITLTNLGTLTGKAAITVEGTTDTVVNAGTIAGSMSTGYGVQLRAPALVVNQAGGTISGTRGIRAEDGAATVANAGTIIGSADAVAFDAGYTNLLAVDPGAAFSGTVDGGNTLGSNVVSTLELASASSAGTLNGLGTRYIDFAQVTIVSGAAWTLRCSVGCGVVVITHTPSGASNWCQVFCGTIVIIPARSAKDCRPSAVVRWSVVAPSMICTISSPWGCCSRAPVPANLAVKIAPLR